MPALTRIEPENRMSSAVIHNGLIYLAGVVGTPTGDVTSQTREIVSEIDRLLALAGSDKTRILRAQVWLSDIRTFDEMNAVWDSWVVPGQAPARATGEARLYSPDCKVEFIITAVQK